MVIQDEADAQDETERAEERVNDVEIRTSEAVNNSDSIGDDPIPTGDIFNRSTTTPDPVTEPVPSGEDLLERLFITPGGKSTEFHGNCADHTNIFC